MAVANRPTTRLSQLTIIYEAVAVLHALEAAGEAQTAAEIAASVSDIPEIRIAEILADLRAIGAVTVSGSDYTRVVAS